MMFMSTTCIWGMGCYKMTITVDTNWDMIRIVQFQWV